METKMIKNENKIYVKYKGFSKKIMTSAVILSIMLPSIPASYANPEEEGEGSIRVYRTSHKAGTLVAPEALNVEYLEVNSAQKKLTVFQTGKEPQEINPLFHPSNFPWSLSQEKMESFLSSQSLLLKQLDNGEYKLNMHTIGKGGILPVIAAITAVSMLSGATVAVFQTGTNQPAEQAKVYAQRGKGKK